MSIIGSNVLAGASGGAGAADYQIQRSLRFNSGDSPSLVRNFASAGNRKTFTFSCWLKVAIEGTQPYGCIFNQPSGDDFFLYNRTNGKIEIFKNNASLLTTSAVFRDPSAWQHFVFAVDTTQSTVSSRFRIYHNGTEITSFSADNRSSNLPQNSEFSINTANAHNIGGDTSHSHLFDGYLADVHFIDGQALAPTDFGEFDDNNVWQPKAYSGTYGTNGFHLDFADNSTAAALGTDTSGAGNDWTVNNISVAAGAGNDSLVDTPTNYEAASGNNGGNYCTLNPLKNQSQTLKNGNLESNGTSGRSTGTLYASSGKFYWEFTAGTSYTMSGIESSTSPYAASYPGENDQQYALYGNAGSGLLYHNGSATSVDGFVSGDVIGVALDMDGGNLYFYKNGSAMNSGSAVVTGLTGAWTANCRSGSGAYNGDTIFNFGQRPFAYTPPTGYVSLCTQNLTDPTIADGSAYMDVVTYQGGSVQTISGLGFSPDLLWYKTRNGAFHHGLQDSVRGVGKSISSSTTSAEYTETTGLTAFTADGFSLNGTGYYYINSNNSMVAWAWDAGANSSKTYAVTVVSDGGNKYRFDGFGTSAVTLDLEEGSTYTFDQSDSSNAGHPLRFSTTSDGTHGSGSEYTTGVTTVGTPGSAGASTTIVVASGAPTLYYYCSVHSGMGGQADTNSTAGASNFDGSLQATVRANPAAGFSIVGFTGGGSGSTFGHGLNAAPHMIIVKDRDVSSDWCVYHKETGGGNFTKLNSTAASAANTTMWGNTDPTSSVFGWGFGSGNDYIAYCFAPVESYSSMGSYTGNGSATDGPFVYTGFRPTFVLIKNADIVENWLLYDSARDPDNGVVEYLLPNSSAAESSTQVWLDFVSNGFKIRASSSAINGNGNDIVYAAFAENPFKTARAR